MHIHAHAHAHAHAHTHTRFCGPKRAETTGAVHDQVRAYDFAKPSLTARGGRGEEEEQADDEEEGRERAAEKSVEQ
eukprot:914515-Alexandrium_andersonii.AAC.1